MIEDFFDHKADIYHIIERQESPGYGLPASSDFTYPDIPDVKEQPCHFNLKSRSTNVLQMHPQQILEEKIKLTLPIGTDIRINDKIIHCDTGLEYTAEVPQNVRNHHLYVLLHRREEQKAL